MSRCEHDLHAEGNFSLKKSRFAGFDLVAALFGMRFGETSPLTAIVYGLVGLAGVYQVVAFKGMPRRWQDQLAAR